MGALDSIVIPQSENSLILLKAILLLTYFILIPYLSLLIGGVFFSVILDFSKKGAYTAIQKKILSPMIVNKWLPIILGVIPLLSSGFILLEILNEEGNNVLQFLLISLITFIVGIIFFYQFTNSLILKELFESADDSDISPELLKIERKTDWHYTRGGTLALFFFLVSLFCLIGANNIAAEPDAWREISFASLFSLSVLVDFILVVLFSLVFSGTVFATLLKGGNEIIENFSSKLVTMVVVSLVIALPLILASLYFDSKDSLNNWGILFVGISILLIFVTYLFSYKILNDTKVKISNFFAVVSLGILLCFIAKEQFAFNTVTKIKSEEISNKYYAHVNEMKSAIGISVVEISGEDIFNGRCIACHKFDVKLVGPSYKEIMPKYSQKKEDMVKFILKPVKVNPDYPAMPNQGLKPKEAEAVAGYIWKTYEGKYQ